MTSPPPIPPTDDEPRRVGHFPLQAPVVPPPGWGASLLKGALVFVACVLMAGLFDPTLLEPQDLPLVIFLAGLAAGGAVYSDRRRATRQRRITAEGRVPPALEILEHGLRWHPLTGPGDELVPFSSLRVAAAFRNRRETVLALGLDERRTVILPAKALGGGAVAREIVSILQHRVDELPGGHRLLEPMARRAQISERLFRPSIPMTWTLVTVLCAVFGAQMLASPILDPVDLLAMGANSATLVLEQGQGWRWLTANLLHGGLLHLALNAWALVVLGRLLEPLLGPGRFLNLLLVSSLAGAIASTLITRPWASVGASTGISGLAGALAVLFWQKPDDFPTNPGRRLVILLVVMLFLPGLLLPNIDNAGHGGGLVAGAALTLIFLRGGDWLQLRRRRAPLHIGLAMVLSLVFLLPTVAATARTLVASPSERAAQISEALSIPGFPDALINNAAWELAVSPAANENQLRRGRRRLEESFGGNERVGKADPAIRDTYATVLFRLGELSPAVKISAATAEQTDSEFHRSQLARFDLARQRRDGTRVAKGLGTLPSLQPEGGRLVARLPQGRSLPAITLRAVVLDAEARPARLVTLKLGAARGPQQWQGPILAPELEDVVITTVLIDSPTDSTDESPIATGEARWQETVVLEEVLELPGPLTPRSTEPPQGTPSPKAKGTASP